MRLSGFQRAIGGRLVGRDVVIRGLAEDSRQVRRGDLFFCIRGARQDGARFAQDAVAAGAAAVAVEGETLPGLTVPQWRVDDMRRALALAAHVYYRDPSRRVKVIGVTGTKGKTTVTYLLRSILKAAGEKAGLIGTITYETGRRIYDAPNTTPSALTVARLLDEMVRSGCRWCVMEVSSHALEMERVLGVRFAGVAFTNLAHEHLDYHRTMEKYFQAKRKLFTGFKTVKARVVNADDPFGRRLLASVKGCVSFGIERPSVHRARAVWVAPERIRFNVGTHAFEAPLTGVFNVYNALTAVAVLREMGWPWEAIRRGLKNASLVPGRFEPVRVGQDFTVLVDYAHAPNALEEALKTARELAGESRLICVFGCGGDRDRTKRPIMGRLSARLADLTVVTSDNPRTEPPNAILKEIVRGVPERLMRNGCRRVFVEGDRAKAIRFAVSKAGTGDVVLIAGKGHETYQIVGDRKSHFDDREEARKALRRRIG